MGVEEDLQGLRAEFPGCTVIAFADLDTRIVLVSASEGTARRDTLDGLCASAVAQFAVADKAGEEAADTALRRVGDVIEIAQRDPERRDEALCAICTPEVDIAGFLSRAREVLRRIGQEGAP